MTNFTTFSNFNFRQNYNLKTNLKTFKFLTIFLVVSTILLQLLVVKTNANPTKINQNIFISEVSFGGSKALNNCKTQDQINDSGDLGQNNLKNMCNFDKWIELYNPSENTINLDGYRVVVQNGLSEILSGQILPKSFLVLSNTNYKYQNIQKIEEDFVPQKLPKKEVENKNNKAQEIQNSSQKLEEKSQNSTQNSSQNLQSKAQNIEKPDNNSEDKANQNSTQNKNFVSSSFSSSFSETTSNKFPSSNISNNLNQNINSQNSQNSNLLLNTNKPNLTIELKNETVPSKTLDFKENPITQNSNPNSQIFFQINLNSLNPKQKDFISNNFKSILTKNNNKYETNSSITNEQKQQLSDQNIDWQLQKRTETKLNSVLVQGNFANYSLGIIHSLSPDNPTITIKNAQNQIISARSFTANWNGQNHYTAEFENADSPPTKATNLYFESTNFGTPGFAKEKEIIKIPQDSTVLPTNLIINPKLETAQSLEQGRKLENQAQIEKEKVLDKQIVHETQKEKVLQNEIKENKVTVQNPNYSTNYELNQNQIGQKISQLENETQKDLAKKLSQNLATTLEERQKNIQLQGQNQLETQKNWQSSNPNFVKPENENLLQNSESKDSELNYNNPLWYIHLQKKSELPISPKIQNINQLDYRSIYQSNISYSKDLTLHQKSDQEFLAKTSNFEIQDKIIKNSTKISSLPYSLVQNNIISGQIFTFKTDSILDFFINLLLLLLAVNKENKNKNNQTSNPISNKKLNFLLKFS